MPTATPITFGRRNVTIGTLPAHYGAGGRRPFVHLEAELTETRFSISGDLKRPGASDIDAGGQIDDMLRGAIDAIDYVPGWNRAKLLELLELWRAWHLNDMTAGCEHQRAGIATDPDDPSAGIAWDARPIDPTKPTNAYGTHYDGQRSSSWNMLSWIRRTEHPRGLLSYPCPECGYKFGSAWLTREIPADVRARLAELLA